jgi:hypothetical protein
VGRVDTVREYFGAAADDHAGSETATAANVEHGELFGDAERRVIGSALPITANRQRRVRWVSAAAMRLGEGMRP